MSVRLAAIAIHLFTASGAILGLLALDYAVYRNWSGAFACLGLALVVDAIDGPLARRFDIARVLPRFSGVRLDLAVDYLNYCVVPGFLITQAPLIGGAPAVLCAAIMLTTSLFHFSDMKSKSDEGYFVGFPAAWNIVVFYLFAFDITGIAAISSILAIASLTFVPLRWVHPVRVVRFRGITSVAVLVWSAAAIYTLYTGFPAEIVPRLIFAAIAVYVCLLCRFREQEKK